MAASKASLDNESNMITVSANCEQLCKVTVMNARWWFNKSPICIITSVTAASVLARYIDLLLETRGSEERRPSSSVHVSSCWVERTVREHASVCLTKRVHTCYRTRFTQTCRVCVHEDLRGIFFDTLQSFRRRLQIDLAELPFKATPISPLCKFTLFSLSLRPSITHSLSLRPSIHLSCLPLHTLHSSVLLFVSLSLLTVLTTSLSLLSSFPLFYVTLSLPPACLHILSQ